MNSKYKTVVVSATVSTVLAILVVYLLGPFHLSDADSRTSSDDLYYQIKSKGIIRAAYAVGAPLFMVNPNTGEKTGIFHDIVEKAAEKIGLKVNWTEEVGYGEMIQGLNNHRYDIVGSGVWMNASRGKDADFTVPLYYDAVFAYAKQGNTKFTNDLSILNSKDFTISTMDGELGASIAKADFPKAKTLALPQNADFTQLILNVVTGKADIVFLAAGPALEYQSVHPGEIAAVGDRPVRIFGNAILIPQGQYILRQALNYALMEMLNEGEISVILKKYEKIPGSFLRVAPPYEISSVQK